MTVTGVILWWLGGFLTASAIAGFSRHKGLGLILLLLGGLLTFWAYTGTSVNVPMPQVHPSASHK